MAPESEGVLTDDPGAYFTALVANHHLDLVRLAYAMVGEIPLAHDVAQAAWTSAWKHRAALREPAKSRGWLLTITANEARRALRRGSGYDYLHVADQHPTRFPRRDGHYGRRWWACHSSARFCTVPPCSESVEIASEPELPSADLLEAQAAALLLTADPDDYPTKPNHLTMPEANH